MAELVGLNLLKLQGIIDQVKMNRFRQKNSDLNFHTEFYKFGCPYGKVAYFDCPEPYPMCNFWDVTWWIYDLLYLKYNIHKNLAHNISKSFP